MFSRIWPVMRKEFIHIRRDPRTLAVMFIAPLMQLILLGYAATTDVRDVPLAVFDQDRTAASRDLVTAFVASGQFAVAQYTSSDRELATLIDGGKARAGLIIPPGYAADLLGRRGAQVVFVLDGSDPSIAGSSLSAARLIGQAKSVSIQTERRCAAPPLEVRTRVWYNPDMASAVFMIPGLIGLVLQLQATLLTSSAIVRERERGTIEQLIITPIRPFELILGKILPYVGCAADHARSSDPGNFLVWRANQGRCRVAAGDLLFISAFNTVDRVADLDRGEYAAGGVSADLSDHAAVGLSFRFHIPDCCDACGVAIHQRHYSTDLLPDCGARHCHQGRRCRSPAVADRRTGVVWRNPDRCRHSAFPQTA